VAPVKTNRVKWGKTDAGDFFVAVERYNIWSISCHARTAPTNATSRIYGLQIRKELK
jgi:hypothetical protein